MSDTDEIEIPPPKKARRSRTTRNSEPIPDFNEEGNNRRRSSRRVTRTILQESTHMSTDDDLQATNTAEETENLDKIEINNPLENKSSDEPLNSRNRSKTIKDISACFDIQSELGKTNKKCSDYLTKLHGVVLPDYEYTESDFTSMTDYKSYYARFKKLLSESNPGIGMIKINAIVAAIFREFKLSSPVDSEENSKLESPEKQASENNITSNIENTENDKNTENSTSIPQENQTTPAKPAKKKSPPKKKSSSPTKEYKSKKVPPIKIRIPTSRGSKKNKKAESDDEFEQRLLELEREQDEADNKKLDAKKKRAEKRKLEAEQAAEREEAERRRREENPEEYEAEKLREAEE